MRCEQSQPGFTDALSNNNSVSRASASPCASVAMTSSAITQLQQLSVFCVRRHHHRPKNASELCYVFVRPKCSISDHFWNGFQVDSELAQIIMNIQVSGWVRGWVGGLFQSLSGVHCIHWYPVPDLRMSANVHSRYGHKPNLLQRRMFPLSMLDTGSIMDIFF